MTRAIAERPWWAKMLFRFAVGKHAFREFVLLVNNISRDGCGPFDEYGCEDHTYFLPDPPWDWWNPAHYEQHNGETKT